MKPLTELEAQAYAALEVLQAKYERKVMLVYADALRKMRGEMVKLYEKYAIEGKLTLAEMTKYNRYASMEKEMISILTPALKQSIADIDRLTPDMYEESFFRYAWAIDNATGLRLQWGTVDKKTILANLLNNFSKISRERYGFEAKLYIRQALNNGLSLGKGIVQMSADLKKALNTSAYNAIRILRTEGRTAQSAGQEYTYLQAKKKGIDGREIWDATLDGRTRPSHGAMDGASKTDEGWVLLNGGTTAGPNGELAMYPGDPNLSAGERINCRCRLRFEIEGYSPQLRRIRGEGVQPYQTYMQWKESQE